MGSITRGLTSVSAIKRGVDTVSAVYRGNQLIWSPAAPTYVTAGLTAFYEIASSTTSTLTDIIGGYDMTATGTVVDGISSNYLGVGGSNGRNAYFTVTFANQTAFNQLQGYGDYTVEGYFYLEQAPSNGTKWWSPKGDANALGGPEGCTDSYRAVIGSVSASPAVLCTATNFSANTWYHAAWVVSGTTAYWYINAVQDATTSFTGARDAGDPGTYRVRMGVIDNGQGYNMRIGNLRIYNGTALTAAQVLQNFNYDKALYGL